MVQFCYQYPPENLFQEGIVYKQFGKECITEDIEINLPKILVYCEYMYRQQAALQESGLMVNVICYQCKYVKDKAALQETFSPSPGFFSG